MNNQVVCLQEELTHLKDKIVAVKRKIDLFEGAFLLRGETLIDERKDKKARIAVLENRFDRIENWLARPWYKRIFRRFPN